MDEDQFDLNFDENGLFWEDFLEESFNQLEFDSPQAQVYERLYMRYKMAEQEVAVFLATIAKAAGIEDPKGRWRNIINNEGRITGVMRVSED